MLVIFLSFNFSEEVVNIVESAFHLPGIAAIDRTLHPKVKRVSRFSNDCVVILEDAESLILETCFMIACIKQHALQSIPWQPNFWNTVPSRVIW